MCIALCLVVLAVTTWVDLPLLDLSGSLAPAVRGLKGARIPHQAVGPGTPPPEVLREASQGEGDDGEGALLEDGEQQQDEQQQEEDATQGEPAYELIEDLAAAALTSTNVTATDFVTVLVNFVGSDVLDLSRPVLATYAMSEEGCAGLSRFFTRRTENFHGTYLFIMMQRDFICPAAKALCDQHACIDAWYFRETNRLPSYHGAHYSHRWAMLKLNLWQHLPPQVETAILLDTDMIALWPVSPRAALHLPRQD